MVIIKEKHRYHAIPLCYKHRKPLPLDEKFLLWCVEMVLMQLKTDQACGCIRSGVKEKMHVNSTTFPIWRDHQERSIA
jgi:hypothetical protein